MIDESRGLIFSKGRLESLTDGVFAIIMTILVFNISVPELLLFTEGEYASERLSNRLLDLWPHIFSYVISFVTLGVYWVAHHRIFRWIVNVDRPLIWINISFLMTIALIPFSTNLVTQYRDQQNSILVYSFNSILAGIIIYSLYHHAKGNRELVDNRIHILTRNLSGKRILATILTYSIAIALFIHIPTCQFISLFTSSAS